MATTPTVAASCCECAATLPHGSTATRRRPGAGGGAILSKGDVDILMRHPAYGDASHPHNARLGAVVREYYKARHPGVHGPDGNGG